MITYKIAKAIESNKPWAVFAKDLRTNTWYTQKTFETKKQAKAFIDYRIEISKGETN